MAIDTLVAPGITVVTELKEFPKKAKRCEWRLLDFIQGRFFRRYFSIPYLREVCFKKATWSILQACAHCDDHHAYVLCDKHWFDWKLDLLPGSMNLNCKCGNVGYVLEVPI